MTDQDKFRFQLGEEEPEPSPPAIDEALQRRVHKLSQRMSFLTLMLPCLIALVIYVAYRDLNLRVAQTQHSELQSVDRIAADLEQKSAALLARVSELEATVGAKLDEVSKSVFALQEGIKKAEAAIERNKTDKADKKELEDSAARVDSALAAMTKEVQGLAREVQGLAPFREELGSASTLRNDVNTVSARLQKLENSLGKDLTGVAGYMDRNKAELAQIKTDMAKLQSGKIDEESIELEILKAKKSYQAALDQEMARIEKTLSTIQRRLDQIERAFAAPAARGTAPAAPGSIREQPLQ
jgi:DNA repair exonuclease SbcCD ATPase subunit